MTQRRFRLWLALLIAGPALSAVALGMTCGALLAHARIGDALLSAIVGVAVAGVATATGAVLALWTRRQ